MIRLPQKRTRIRMNVREPYLLRCPPHIRFIKSLNCTINNTECEGPIDPHHIKEGNPGMGATNHDSDTVPLCRFHHERGDSVGWSWKRFEAHYKVDLSVIAANLWRISRPRMEWERKRAANDDEAK